MSDYDYDAEVKKINQYNEPIMDGFQAWLKASGLAPKTIKKHLENIDFFADYLTYYEPLIPLDEADETDVNGFLMDWYPRKAMWASPAYTRAYIATFGKFFPYLHESGRIDQEVVAMVKTLIRERKQDFLDAVAFADDDDEYW
jgi:hypothetical protein